MKKTFLACMIITAMIFVCACSGGKSEVQVPVQSVAEITGLGPLGVAQRFAGVVSVQDPVKIMKIADAKVGEMNVQEGDAVKEGDILFTYDTDQLNLDLEKAKLELEKLYNDINNLQNERNNLENEKAKAPSEQQLEYSLEINSKDTEILEANYNSQVKQKEIESLEKSLQNATVKAPSPGRIGTITDGEQTDNMGNPQPLITIVQTNDLLIKGSINENNIYALTPGMDLTIRSRVDERTWKGTLSRIDTDNPVQNQEMYMIAVDSVEGTSNSSKYPFYVDIEDTEGLMLGQHVYVEPYYGEGTGDTWRLPSWYIADIDGKAYVWAQSDNGKLEKRFVSLGAPSDDSMNMDSYEIIAGLSLEDKIAMPSDTLEEGMVCVDYKEYVPAADENTGGEAMIEGVDMPAGEDMIIPEDMEMPAGAEMPETAGVDGRNIEEGMEMPAEEETTSAMETAADGGN